MNKNELQHVLDQFKDHKIAVIGDFFLDRYLFIDPALNELSIETGKTAYQVVNKRPQPGAAGTVCNNLHALGVGNLFAVSVIGDDGEGYELRKTLVQRHIDIENVVVSEKRFTPTYTKPMLKTPDGDEEMNRQDIKNRNPLSSNLENEVMQKFERLLPQLDAVIIADQVQERNCGIITDSIRNFLAEMAHRFPNVIFFADSRERIGEFRNIIIKPNRVEASKAINPNVDGAPDTDRAVQTAKQLSDITKKPVFLTLDKEGICPVYEEKATLVPCPPVSVPIDIVGAGDSVTAGIVSALASKASLTQAAIIGNLVASVTIRQLGTTGIASPEQVVSAFEANQDLYSSIN